MIWRLLRALQFLGGPAYKLLEHPTVRAAEMACLRNASRCGLPQGKGTRQKPNKILHGEGLQEVAMLKSITLKASHQPQLACLQAGPAPWQAPVPETEES